MHGTGATLGFTDVAAQAGQLEKLSEAAPPDFDAMSACVAEMERLVTDGAPGRS